MKWGNLIKLIVPWCTSVQFAMTNINNNKEWGNMFLFNIILQLPYAWFNLGWGRQSWWEELSGKQYLVNLHIYMSQVAHQAGIIPVCYIASKTFTQQNEHCDWLILGHVPLIKFKCTRPGYNCAVVALTPNFAIWLFTGKSKYITKHLMYGPLGNVVSFVFPRVLMFPLTSSQETSGLSRKQN